METTKCSVTLAHGEGYQQVAQFRSKVSNSTKLGFTYGKSPKQGKSPVAKFYNIMFHISLENYPALHCIAERLYEVATAVGVT